MRCLSAARGGALGVLLGGVVLVASASPAVAAPKAGTATFDRPGAFSWTVPKGVHFATFDVYGAMGGSLPGVAFGGLGAHVRATIAVPSGGAMTILVGGAGAGAGGGDGGFGGGAAGGAGSSDLTVLHLTLSGGPGGAGGGGASDVRTGPADSSGLASRLLVAGGGGGAGGVGGGAGGPVGEDGADGPVLFNGVPGGTVLGGGGGTATAGGAGGGGGGPGGPGTPGGLGTGGPGADAPATQLVFLGGRVAVHERGQGGGGGGGGLFGGGGGGSANLVNLGAGEILGTAAGGGGGSSLVPGDAICPTLVETGVRAGDGLVVITFAKGKKPDRACPAG